MALMKCPECGGQVSDSAESCPHCGFPMSQYVEEKRRTDYVEYLKNKIKPVDFKCPPPRVRVCIRCATLFSRRTGKPLCKCGMEGVEVDYPENGDNGDIGIFKYIVEHDVIPRNIGDQMSKEYQDCIGEIEEHNEWRKAEGRPPVMPIPPDPKDFGISVEYKPRKHTPLSSKPEPKLPRCPFCQSTDLTRISSVGKAVKILALGLYGMDDAGKTYRCNNCGGKF